jgi:D-serine deaminase-like pyridoxal phosphate-dependent protein
MMLIPDIDTPALLVDFSVLQTNIISMARRINGAGLRLRPHAKTHKTIEIARMQLDAGASGITVAKIGEAEVMADAGMDDILIANQIAGPAKIERLRALARRVSVAVAVDSVDIAAPLSAAFAAQGMRLPVLLEIDVGAHRCGIAPDAAESLAEQLIVMPGIKLVGLLTYPGHAYDACSPEEVACIAEHECRLASDLCRRLSRFADLSGWVSGGTTPTSAYYRLGCGITEVRAGSYVFRDRAAHDAWSAQPSECALTVLATVINVRQGVSAVIDAGLKAVGNDLVPRSTGLGMLKEDNAAVITKLYEEHAILDLSNSTMRLRPADKVEVVVNSAGPVVNLFDEMHVVENGEVVDVWRIAARGRSR